MRTRKILALGYRPGANRPDINAEPCSGDCYAYDDVLDAADASWDMSTLTTTCQHLLAIHERICGDGRHRVGISLDESRWAYIGSYYHDGSEAIVTGGSLTEVVEALAEEVAAHADSATPRPSACAHGEAGALVDWMLSAGRVPVSKRHALRAALLSP